MTAPVVVWVPRRTFSLISPTRSRRPGSSAFSRLDFPAPLGPVTTLSCPSSAARSSSSPAPVFTLVQCTG